MFSGMYIIEITKYIYILKAMKYIQTMLEKIFIS